MMARTAERATVTSTLSERVVGSGRYYGRDLFKPGTIVGQIVAIHMFFYLTLGLLLFTMDEIVGVYDVSIVRQMLDWRTLQYTTSSGVVALICFAASSVGCGSLAFVVIVGRSRRALDFAMTIIAVHFCCTCIYSSDIPKSATWWTTNAACAAAMTLVGETLSRRRELRDINMNMNINNNNAGKTNGGGEEERDVEAQLEANEA